MDAVYASKFITARKSKVLIEKLGRFTSRIPAGGAGPQGAGLRAGEEHRREDSVQRGYRCTAAITRGRPGAASNTATGTCKSRWRRRHDGQLYTVSPWVLVWENGNYYYDRLHRGASEALPRGQDAQGGAAAGYRTREGAGEYAEFDVNQYMQQMFDMFNGPVLKRVTAAMREPLCRGDDRPVRHRADPGAHPAPTATTLR